MERCQLFFEVGPATIFVFDDLLAHLKNKRMEKVALAAHQWALAFDAWQADLVVCNYIRQFTEKYPTVPVELITWRPSGFADCIRDFTSDLRIPIRDVRFGSYEELSPSIATDNDVQIVYDPDPHHRFGYGFKARQFSTTAL